MIGSLIFKNIKASMKGKSFVHCNIFFIYFSVASDGMHEVEWVICSTRNSELEIRSVGQARFIAFHL